jgi:hypothetical protein
MNTVISLLFQIAVFVFVLFVTLYSRNVMRRQRKLIETLLTQNERMVESARTSAGMIAALNKENRRYYDELLEMKGGVDVLKDEFRAFEFSQN